MRKTRTPILRKSAPKKTNPARRKREWARAYGSKEYVAWIHEQPCYACGVYRYSQCAHIQTGGMGRKDDWTRTIPLCGPRTIFGDRSQTLYAGCHWIFDNKGIEALGDLFGPFDPAKAAEQTHTRWLSSLGSSQGGET